MSEFRRKNYDNSYLFNKTPDETQRHHRELMEYIIKADRIDKSSEAFGGIIESVKRNQNTSVLYSVLMRDDVVLCIRDPELPRAFKVFEAKDLRMKDGPKVFIDVTKIIKLDGNYFTCREIDKLISYLFAAMGYLIYRYEPVKLMNNSNLTIAGAECFVSMFDYIIDYLRIIGFSENKPAISYLTGLYFLHNLMSKDIDNYTCNIAAKVAGITTTQQRAFNMYYDSEDVFLNIGTFVEFICDTFKLKGLDDEVFLQKWIYQFGTGTQFATELFTSFSTLMAHAYCGAYIVNHKQIERCCGASMVKFATSLIKIGTELLDKRGWMESSEFEKTLPHDIHSLELKESLEKRNKSSVVILTNDCTNFEILDSKFSELIDYFKSIHLEDKISSSALNVVIAINKNYTEGVMEKFLSKYGMYLENKDKISASNLINNEIASLREKLSDSFDKNEKDENTGKKMVEYMNSLSYL